MLPHPSSEMGPKPAYNAPNARLTLEPLLEIATNIFEVWIKGGDHCVLPEVFLPQEEDHEFLGNTFSLWCGKTTIIIGFATTLPF